MSDRPQRRLHTPAELAESLRRLKEFSDKVDAVPESQRKPISNPEKYADPIGADADGNIITYRRLKDIPDDPRFPSKDSGSDAVDPRVAALSSALAKLPAHAGIVYRGTTLGPEVLAQYEAGQIVTERGFTSTTRDIGEAVSGNTCFVVLSSHGKDISVLSQAPGEQEVLFDHDTDFWVIDILLDVPTRIAFISLAEEFTDSAEISSAELDRVKVALQQAVSELRARLAGQGVPQARSAPSKFDGPIGATNEGGVLITGRYGVTES